ncbi:MAG TPA: cation transporter [Terriglobales bacterium]|nr:cation transporter [Terriglobales bacterium]
MATEKAQLKINGMSCGHCVTAVERALDQLPGVTARQVRVGSADIQYDPERVGLEQIRKAITDEGYEAA